MLFLLVKSADQRDVVTSVMVKYVIARVIASEVCCFYAKRKWLFRWCGRLGGGIR
jgi:hypothetical protein